MNTIKPTGEEVDNLLEPEVIGSPATLWQVFALAVQFLTRVPLSGNAPPTTDALARSPVFFPLVGALIGVFTTAICMLASLLWPPWLAVIIALGCEALLTGALHEDAVADFCDAFGGGRTRERTLEILRDSRIGAFGSLGLFTAASLRAGAMIALIGYWGVAGWTRWSSVFVASSALGRLAIVVAMAMVPPVPGRDSLARTMGSTSSVPRVFVSALLILPAIVPFAFMLPTHFVVSLLLLSLVVGGLLRLVRRRLGGMTGDCLGFIGYVGQIVVLLAAAARKQSWGASL